MEGSLQRGLLFGLTVLLSGCVAGTVPPETASNTELKSLPVNSKVYFRNPVEVPPRTERIWLLYERTRGGLRVALAIPSADTNRIIETGTPFTVERVDYVRKPEKSGACGAIIHLGSPSGVMMQLQSSRAGEFGSCLSPTLGDLADLVTIIIAPPEPIR